jgi:probable phosphoglycerate mutase
MGLPGHSGEVISTHGYFLPNAGGQICAATPRRSGYGWALMLECFMAATLYLIRHATPDWSRTDIRYDIPPGPPLTDVGEREARQLAEFLKTTNIAHVYASPLERTSRTAQIAADALGVKVEIAPDLAEWERVELEADVLSRVRAFVDEAFDESELRGPLALVTHGGPIRVVLADIGLERSEMDHYRRTFDRDNPVPPAGVWRVTRTSEGILEKPELVFTPQPYTPFVPSTVHV